MRTILVTIKRGDPGKGENQLVYPARYDAVEVDRFGMSAPTLNQAGVSMSGEVGKGGDVEHCVIILPDALAEEYASDPDMRIITSGEADAFMEDCRIKNGIPEEIVTDPIRITAIRAKQEAGLPLSAGDVAALNPESPERGLGKSRRPVSEKAEINDELSTLPEGMKSIAREPVPVERAAK